MISRLLPEFFFPLATALLALAGLILAARRRRQNTRTRIHLRAVKATAEISTAALDPTCRDIPMSALGAASGTVTCLLSLYQPGTAAAPRVTAPPGHLGKADRAVVSLLASLRLVPEKVPELARVIAGRRPAEGADITDLLRQAETSLPSFSRRRLLGRVRPAPYVAVPVVRNGDVLAVLIGLCPPGTPADLPQRLARAAARFAILGAAPLPHPTTHQRPRAGGAELLLWLDAGGAVVAHEVLFNEWKPLPPPSSISALFGDDTERALLAMERARAAGQAAPVPVMVSETGIAELSLIALTDVDGNTWGYAALLRQVGSSAAPAVTAARPTSHPAFARR